MTPHEAIERIRATTAMPPMAWHAEYDPMHHQIFYWLEGRVRDANQPDRSSTSVSGRFVLAGWDLDHPQAEEQLDWRLVDHACSWAVHEAREWTRRDGRLLSDPHAPR